MSGSPTFARSPESVAFETMWLSLPRSGRVPERRSFHPRLARAFLRHLVLVDVGSSEKPELRIRLAGDAIRQQVQGEIVGMNYLDFLQTEIHKLEAVGRLTELFERACGHWWVAPVHYERAFSQYWEITAFPLAAGERRSAAVLALIKPMGAVPEARNTGRMVSVDPAVQFEAIAVEHKTT